jgi:hypothetical protein
MMTVVPLISRNSRCTASSVVAVLHGDAGPRNARHTGVLLGLVGDDDDLLHAFGAHALRDLHHAVASGRSPTCWPPVMATASL